MNLKDENDLKREISHIFESGANEIRIFEMVKSFIEKRYVELDCAKSSLDLNSLEMRLDEALGKETRESLEEWLKLKRSIKK